MVRLNTTRFGPESCSRRGPELRSQHMITKITQALVERAATPERGKSTLYADSEMRGFYLIVTPTKRSFYVQSLVNGKQVRTKLGDHPVMDAKQARDAARQTLVGMRAGTNPNEERRRARARGIT